MAQFKNLVFEGGGVKGIAYAGATKVLDEKLPLYYQMRYLIQIQSPKNCYVILSRQVQLLRYKMMGKQKLVLFF